MSTIIMSDDGESPNQPKGWIRPTPVYHAHFDCFSGAAGDMMLAAALDAAGDRSQQLQDHIVECLEKGLSELHGEFQIERKQVWRGGKGSIAASHVTVHSRYNHEPAPVPLAATPSSSSPTDNDDDAAAVSHAHDHSHSHSHSHLHDHAHSHTHDHKHPEGDAPSTRHHEHAHSHPAVGDHSHTHSHSKGPLRNFPQIRAMLKAAPAKTYIPTWVQTHAIAAFLALAHAESQTHGASGPESVHFHEVGAVDSLVDTIGTLLALHALGVTSVSCSRLPLGEGTVWTDHGLLPVPAPATLRLLQDMPCCAGPPGVTGELVTPTAAALLKVLTQPNDTQKKGKKSPPGRPPDMILRKVGIGAGTKDFENHPNILRLMLGECQ